MGGLPGPGGFPPHFWADSGAVVVGRALLCSRRGPKLLVRPEAKSVRSTFGVTSSQIRGQGGRRGPFSPGMLTAFPPPHGP